MFTEQQLNNNKMLMITNLKKLVSETTNAIPTELREYSRAVTPQIRQAGNRLSGLVETAYASLLA